MSPEEVGELESEFEVHFPIDYRESITSPTAVESSLAFCVDLESLRSMNQDCRQKDPWDFEWEPSFWCIGTNWIGNRNGSFCHFIDCNDATSFVYTLTKVLPAWTISDKNRLNPVALKSYLSSLQQSQAEAKQQEQLAIQYLKRKLSKRWWHISFRRLPKLPAPPDWMTTELEHRSGLSRHRCVELLMSATAEESWCALNASQNQSFEELLSQQEYYKRLLYPGGDLLDQIELDDRYAPYLLRAGLLTDRALNGKKRGLGFCHLFWRTMQDILKHQFGIDWKTPAEMNPAVSYD